MKIDCVIDGKALSLSLNSNKPLSLILAEDIQNRHAFPDHSPLLPLPFFPVYAAARLL